MFLPILLAVVALFMLNAPFMAALIFVFGMFHMTFFMWIAFLIAIFSKE